MKLLLRKSLSVIAVIVMVTISQLLSLSNVFAAPGSADLNVTAGMVAYEGRALLPLVCNDGDETVVEFQLNVTLTNVELDQYVVWNADAVGQTPAIDEGTVDENGLWTGSMENGQCVLPAIVSDVIGELGEQIEATVWVTDSVLEGDIENTDPNNANDTATFGPIEIINLPDVSITTRLLTSGTITAGTTITYEGIVSNVGLGAALQANDQQFPNLFFLIPDGTTLDEVVDADLGDNVELDNCLNQPAANLGFVGYPNHTAILCFLVLNADFEPGDTSPFQFSLDVSEDFVSGETEVYAASGGPDVETLYIQVALTNGQDPFALGFNNVTRLTYNTDELETTVTRCPGQSEVTTNGTGCFRVSFNKLIWAPSFTQDDLVLTGGAEISTFTQIDDYTWQVNVTSIPQGGTVTLALVDDSVQDFNAVILSVQVLGENTIRYEIADSSGGNSAEDDAPSSVTGSLPATGANLAWPYGLILLMFGVLLLSTSHSRRKIRQDEKDGPFLIVE